MLEPSVAAFNAEKSKVELRLIPNTHGPISTDDVNQLLKQPNFAMLFPITPAIDKDREITSYFSLLLSVKMAVLASALVTIKCKQQ
jgi:hypothetical protein